MFILENKRNLLKVKSGKERCWKRCSWLKRSDLVDKQFHFLFGSFHVDLGNVFHSWFKNFDFESWFFLTELTSRDFDYLYGCVGVLVWQANHTHLISWYHSVNVGVIICVSATGLQLKKTLITSSNEGSNDFEKEGRIKLNHADEYTHNLMNFLHYSN